MEIPKFKKISKQKRKYLYNKVGNLLENYPSDFIGYKIFFGINLPEPPLFKILTKQCLREFNCNGYLPELQFFSMFKEVDKNDKFYMQKLLSINNNITTKEKALMCYFMAEMC